MEKLKTTLLVKWSNHVKNKELLGVEDKEINRVKLAC